MSAPGGHQEFQQRKLSANEGYKALGQASKQRQDVNSILRLAESSSSSIEDEDVEQVELLATDQQFVSSQDRDADANDDDGERQAKQQDQFSRQQEMRQQQQQQPHKDYDEVKQVELFGVCIVALTINGKERLCLAQISNTLLKEFSYNEIHNRRVALGITCVQCTPIQLEMLRRAGAMPSSSRRCGMITMREAERLCRSFLVEEQPPDLPENFYFTVAHRINYGCKGRFVPARYISSRAKCIECFYCGEFYSPNKFIFHSHRQPDATDCNPPDSPNINSWRKHIDLDWSHEHSQDIKYAWEDVKSLFNGGTRRRAPNGPAPSASDSAHLVRATNLSDSEQLIDVDDSIGKEKLVLSRQTRDKTWTGQQVANNSLMLNPPAARLSLMGNKSSSAGGASKRPAPAIDLHSHANKHRFSATSHNSDKREQAAPIPPVQHQQHNQMFQTPRSSSTAIPPAPFSSAQTTSADYPTPTLTPNGRPDSSGRNKQLVYPSNFIYSQLYSQLVQPQPQQQQQQQQVSGRNEQQFVSAVDAQFALRHHLWSSLLANLQCNANSQTYTPFAHMPATCNTPSGASNSMRAPGEGLDALPQASAAANLGHLISAQLYGPALKSHQSVANQAPYREASRGSPANQAAAVYNTPPTTTVHKSYSQINESANDV